MLKIKQKILKVKCDNIDGNLSLLYGFFSLNKLTFMKYLLIGGSRKCSCHCLLSFCTDAAYARWLNVGLSRMRSTVIGFRPLFLSANEVNCCRWSRTMQHPLCNSHRHGSVECLRIVGRLSFHIALWSCSNTPISFVSYRWLWRVVQTESRSFEPAFKIRLISVWM